VQEGQKVKKGEKLMTFDTAYVKANAPSDACLCVFTDLQDGQEVSLLKSGIVKALEDAVEIK
jgi:PTS system D-glucosamine-specific IIC component